ncbi:hypothetical protein RND81_11G089500 [Saponaria officinalis]|uniref:Uncharacterized protein n=1 Tax=Saponaria officinalis TaxID=3572 RepID=A0AAW1HJT0_SAPOF
MVGPDSYGRSTLEYYHKDKFFAAETMHDLCNCLQQVAAKAQELGVGANQGRPEGDRANAERVLAAEVEARGDVGVNEAEQVGAEEEEADDKEYISNEDFDFP